MMAASSGSRFLWAGLLAPPILVLASAGALMVWPQQLVALMDGASRIWSPAAPRRTYRPPQGQTPPPPSPQPPLPMLKGMVRTPDGTPFQGRYRLTTLHSGRRGLGFGFGYGAQYNTGPDFEVRAQGPKTWVLVDAPGYAAAVVGPLEFDAIRPDLEPIAVKLEEGFPHRVRVVDAHGGPIVGALVHASLTLDHGAAPLDAALATDDEGWAVFPHVKEADYEFDVTVYNFVSPDDTVFVRPLPGTDTMITLDRSATRGSVVDEDDRPVADAVILIAAELDERIERHDLHSFHRVVAAKSDAEGRFVLPYLHRDSAYLIQAEGPDGSLGYAPGVRLKGPEVRITLRPRRMVRGIVEGGPSPAGGVFIERSIPTGFEARGPQGAMEIVKRWGTSIILDAQGRFEYPAWGSIDTELKVASQPVPVPWPPPPEPIRVQVPVVEPVERTVRLRIAADPSIRPVNGTMTLLLRNAPPERARQQVSRQVEIRDGVGSFLCLEAESFQFDRGAIPGYWTAPGSINGGVGIGDRFVDVRVYAAGAIRGRVVNADGTPVGEGAQIRAEYDATWAAAVQATPMPEGMRTHVEGPMGRMVQRDPPPPPPSIEATKTGAAGDFELRPWPLNVSCRIAVHHGFLRQTAEPVVIDGHGPRPDLEIRLPRAMKAEVRIVDEQGRPLAGAACRVAQSRPDQPIHFLGFPGTTSDGDGRVVLDGLAEGEKGYTLHVSFPKDYQPISTRLDPGGPPLLLQAKRGKVLEGRLVEAVTGWPIPKVQLAAWQGDTLAYVEAPTDDDGRFRFSTLREGEIRLEDLGALTHLPFATQGWPAFEAGRTPPVVLPARDLREHGPQPRRPTSP